MPWPRRTGRPAAPLRAVVPAAWPRRDLDLRPRHRLGVAQVYLTGQGYHVIETEGGHVDYAPLDAIEDALALRLRTQFIRVSAERVVAGPGIAAIYETLAAIEGRSPVLRDDKAIWRRHWTDRTAWPTPRSTASSWRSARSPAISHWRREPAAW